MTNGTLCSCWGLSHCLPSRIVFHSLNHCFQSLCNKKDHRLLALHLVLFLIAQWDQMHAPTSCLLSLLWSSGTNKHISLESVGTVTKLGLGKDGCPGFKDTCQNSLPSASLTVTFTSLPRGMEKHRNFRNLQTVLWDLATLINDTLGFWTYELATSACSLQYVCDIVYLQYSQVLANVATLFSSLSLSDEQESVQKRTFTKWINTHLAKVIIGFSLYILHSKQQFWIKNNIRNEAGSTILLISKGCFSEQKPGCIKLICGFERW